MTQSKTSSRPSSFPTGLFNWYTSTHRGFIFSKRMRIVDAMTAAMHEAERLEQSVGEPDEIYVDPASNQ